MYNGSKNGAHETPREHKQGEGKMIAKYNGKCDLTGTKIIAGETEIAKYGRFTLLAEYATPEAIDAWFAAQIAEYTNIIAELRSITGREFANAVSDFEATVQRRRSDKMSDLKFTAERTRGEVEQMQRNLNAKRQNA
jgi:hypothetical protein